MDVLYPEWLDPPSTSSSFLLSSLSTRKSQQTTTHPEQADRQIDKQQTDAAPQPNPLPHRTHGPKYAARHPLAQILVGKLLIFVGPELLGS